MYGLIYAVEEGEMRLWQITSWLCQQLVYLWTPSSSKTVDNNLQPIILGHRKSTNLREIVEAQWLRVRYLLD